MHDTVTADGLVMAASYQRMPPSVLTGPTPSSVRAIAFEGPDLYARPLVVPTVHAASTPSGQSVWNVVHSPGASVSPTHTVLVVPGLSSQPIWTLSTFTVTELSLVTTPSRKCR